VVKPYNQRPINKREPIGENRYAFDLEGRLSRGDRPLSGERVVTIYPGAPELGEDFRITYLFVTLVMSIHFFFQTALDHHDES
jgi:hypothetical protein